MPFEHVETDRDGPAAPPRAPGDEAVKEEHSAVGVACWSDEALTGSRLDGRDHDVDQADRSAAAPRDEVRGKLMLEALGTVLSQADLAGSRLHIAAGAPSAYPGFDARLPA